MHLIPPHFSCFFVFYIRFYSHLFYRYRSFKHNNSWRRLSSHA